MLGFSRLLSVQVSTKMHMLKFDNLTLFSPKIYLSQEIMTDRLV